MYGGKQSLLAGWFAAADQRKPLQIAGDGNNHWAMVNLHDLADCYVRIVEQRATGIFHGVDDSGVTLNECAHLVAPSGKIEHVAAEGPFGQALTLDQNVSSEATRRNRSRILSESKIADASLCASKWIRVYSSSRSSCSASQ